MSEPNIQIGCVSNIYIRMMKFINRGDIEAGHSHEFDHISLLTNGSAKVTVDGQSTTFTAPQMIYIQKNKIHSLEALEDNTQIYCIHGLRGINKTDDDILDPAMIPMGINPILANIARTVVNDLE